VLEMPALADGLRCEDDASYRFSVFVTQGAQGIAVTVRCPEANFFQEFPYDPQNPLWAAGYVHQALTTYVPQFVRWRLQGGEVSWAQRAGIPAVAGEPCSYLLARFVGDRVAANQRLDAGPAQGWWLGQTGAPGVIARPGGPIASVGKGGGDPTYLSAAARDAAARGETIASVGNLQALARVSKPGMALMALAGLGIFQALLWFINALSVVAFYLEDSLFALAFSLFASVMLLMGGAVAMLGGFHYRKLRKGPLPLVAIAYAAVVPMCCVFGIPVAVWAAITWRDPMVRQAVKGSPG
jgi:hypothetical protein